jgi:DnaJ-class molecular chaperone
VCLLASDEALVCLGQASQADIKKAYRQLSQVYHPDVNQEQGAQERFIEISNAYSILGDSEERYGERKGGI